MHRPALTVGPATGGTGAQQTLASMGRIGADPHSQDLSLGVSAGGRVTREFGALARVSLPHSREAVLAKEQRQEKASTSAV